MSASRVHVRYLHGFASGPATTTKGRAVVAHGQARCASAAIPDLEHGDFLGLTPQKLLERARAALPPADEPVLLVGSSLGGWLAASLAAAGVPKLAGLVLLAPAVGFVSRWRQRLGPAGEAAWRSAGQRDFFHFAHGCERPLGVGFLDGCKSVDEYPPLPPVPTWVIAGRHDDTVPLSDILAWTAPCPWLDLAVLDGAHSLDSPQHLRLLLHAVDDLIERYDA
jgi:pimeloyl-ACP methyl ester carboxylesterase